MMNKQISSKSPALFEKCVFQCEARRFDSVDESQLEMTYRWLQERQNRADIIFNIITCIYYILGNVQDRCESLISNIEIIIIYECQDHLE